MKPICKIMASSACFYTLTLLAFLLTTPSLSETMKCRPKDQQILLKIKKAFHDPYTLASWVPGTDCCDWYAVGCDEITNHIIGLDISGADDISTQIPDAISELTLLKSLTLRKMPNLTGTIPPSISTLTHLTSLWISFTNISGTIPSFLSKLKNLDYLNLSFNNLTGSIPPSLASLRKLGGLRLDRNKLSGPIPDSFGNITPTLQYLYLSHNQLSGTIPRNWGNLPFLIMQLQRNRIEGDISFLFGKNSSVQQVDFSRNLLKFDLEKIQYPKDMFDLDLNHNKIFGKVPKSFTGMPNLYLNVSYNRLCGQIPVGGRLQGFDETAFFHNRCLCGAPLPNKCTKTRSL